MFATKAFETTAYYESLISNWFNRDNPDYCISKSSIPLNKISNLRYGENPHQKAAYYKFGKSAFTKIHGKDLSFNNIYDLESAISVSTEFKKCSCVIVKHGNPCGVALDKLQHKAYEKAFRCDEISAFGGVVAFNNKLTEKTAALINKIFTEVVIAPDFSKKARILLTSKKNIILIKYKTSKLKENFHIKSTQNFILIQQRDKKSVSAKEIIIDNKEKLSKKIIDDMLFAFKVSKYVSSNAIVAAADQATIGIGVGQTSRIESAKQAIKKIKKNNENQKIVLASDGFFPFSDIVKLCAKNNINFIIQPGGSINDKKIKAEAKKLNVNIAFTNIRHFKH